MKATGCHKGDGKAEPNWEKFSLVKTVLDLIENPTSPDLMESIGFILKNPPKRQIIVKNCLDWDSTEPDSKSLSHKLLLYICRVRNNLFHGGKFNNHWFDPERSAPLLHHSLVILSAVREIVPEVKEAYEREP